MSSPTNTTSSAHPLSDTSRVLRGSVAVAALLVVAYVAWLVPWLNLDVTAPNAASNLLELVTVLFSLALFAVVVTNWPQLFAMAATTGISVYIIGFTEWAPTVVMVINLGLSTVVAFVGTGTRTIFK